MTNLQDAIALHQALVNRLKRAELIQNPGIEAAFRVIARHWFLPGVDLERVYRNEAIVTKRQGEEPISSSSEPAVMAIMLEQLGLEPGQRVLEIGAGTGYNAALLAHLVGETGQVITLDLDPDTAQNARQHLVAAGFDSVQVVCGDGGLGYAAAAPYDCIILTVAAWDLLPAWLEQLKPGGRLLLPLILREGTQRTVAFERADGYWVSRSVRNCGFMKLRGAHAQPPKELPQESPEESPQESPDAAGLAPVTSERQLQPVTQAAWAFLLRGFSSLPLPVRLKGGLLLDWTTFGLPAQGNLRIRAYPRDQNYTPSRQELVIDKQWTRLVLDWQ